jgi:hypothetical protein
MSAKLKIRGSYLAGVLYMIRMLNKGYLFIRRAEFKEIEESFNRFKTESFFDSMESIGKELCANNNISDMKIAKVIIDKEWNMYTFQGVDSRHFNDYDINILEKSLMFQISFEEFEKIWKNRFEFEDVTKNIYEIIEFCRFDATNFRPDFSMGNFECIMVIFDFATFQVSGLWAEKQDDVTLTRGF